MKLEIPNPCSEDWNNMKPVEDGAFCGVCQKKVHDFSKQKTERVKKFLEEKNPDEKICGRFSTQQFLELNFDDFFSKFKLWNLTRKLAVIIFLGFGIGLSGCGGNTTGEPQITGSLKKSPAQTTDTTQTLTTDTIGVIKNPK